MSNPIGRLAGESRSYLPATPWKKLARRRQRRSWIGSHGSELSTRSTRRQVIADRSWVAARTPAAAAAAAMSAGRSEEQSSSMRGSHWRRSTIGARIAKFIGVRTSTSTRDRKSTRLNSSHLGISYAVFCLKKKKDTLDIRSRKTYG